jgi:hypothetical protein
MHGTVDISADSRARRRERLFDYLEDADLADAVVVTADRDVTPTLGQYRSERDVAIAWESEQTGTDD